MKSSKAIILLSGGIDSATCLAMAIKQLYEPLCLTFDYGQRHKIEILSAMRIAQYFGVQSHKIMNVDLRQIGGSSLTDSIDVPQGRDNPRLRDDIPTTYVPARNTIFLSFALAYAEVSGAGDIFIGVNAVDFSGYPDCRPIYIRKFEEMAQVAIKATSQGTARIKIHSPLIELRKADIIKTACALGVDLAMTHSCYDPSPEGHACGVCESCLLRMKGFLEAGIPDPTVY